MRVKLFSIFIILGVCILLVSGCSNIDKQTLRIVSGSENETLEPILETFSKKNNIEIEMVYKGSVDIMNMLSTTEIEKYDGVWPANNLWISMGDIQHKIKYEKSIMTSPIVFGIKESVAEDLRFIGKEVLV